MHTENRTETDHGEVREIPLRADLKTHGKLNGRGNGAAAKAVGRRVHLSIVPSRAVEIPGLTTAGRSSWRATLASLPGLLNRGLYQAGIKRGVDLVFGSLLLVLCSPIIALAWLAVRLTSRGPAIFAQQRVGLGGKPVTMYKLRSMYVDQEHRVDMDGIREGQANGLLHKTNNDPRVTPMGWLLRKTSIDELPQLWNVVRGDMSLVGPRPLVPYMLTPYPEIMAERSRVRPGITGLWQVSAREDNTSVQGMVKYDLHYVKHCTMLVDLWILLRTPFAVLFANGAQ